MPEITRPTVTFVADELLGYAGNGIGTTTTFVSLALARRAHDVEILFAGSPPETVDPEWQRMYDEAGIRVRVVPAGDERIEPASFRRAAAVEAALLEDSPAVVVAQDLGAPAYSAIRLRTLGLAFERTSFVVLCHGTRQWITDVARKVRVLPGAHAVTLLERASIELADAVVSPSAYLVDWMRGEGWQLPERTFVIPHVSRSAATGEPPPLRAPEAARVERLVFFGRLEERKGVRPFIKALNALGAEVLSDVKVEFLGRPTPPWPVDRVRDLLRISQCASFETALDQDEAIALLRRPGTLAVMPSFEENSPNTVYECLENGIPFIASNVAGIRELVAQVDHERVLFEPTPEGIAEALRGALGQPPRPARASFDNDDSLRRWEDVLSLPRPDFPAHGVSRLDESAWAVLLEEDDVAEPELVQTLVRAQEVSGADVVTCGVVVDGTTYLFPGEPRALGLLANGYGTVALVRRSLLTDERKPWPLFSSLALAGAKVVSVPSPLARQRVPPRNLRNAPDEALRVLRYFERATPPNLRFVAELVPRLAAELDRQQSAPRRTSFARRAARRLLAGRSR
jgi:glycosyltransferase involved in cell wall biosynthesis